jgi:hypothetical protein
MLKNIISAERLINACRWFEEIPTSQSQNAMSINDIDEIANVATRKAQELGYESAIRKRIANAITWVKAESSEARFNRLVAKVETKFGKGVLAENAVTHFNGHFKPASEKEFAAFSKSIRAMEALCYLLTAMDLPISSKGLTRTGSNPVVRNYRDAFE